MDDVLAVFRIRIGFSADPELAFSVNVDPDSVPDPWFGKFTAEKN
jgi:hypothetical protein